MANFAITTPQVVDSLNYVLSGPSSIGNDFKGKATEPFFYFTGTNSPPYTSAAIPASPPPLNTNIKTDMFLPVSISDPSQQINVAFQIRPWAKWTLNSFSDFRFYMELLRYNAEQPNDPSPPVLSSTSVFYATATNSDPNGDIITTGTAGLVIPTLIDEPGAVGSYIYWVTLYIEDIGFLDGTIDWIGADSCGISASLIKR